MFLSERRPGRLAFHSFLVTTESSARLVPPFFHSGWLLTGLLSLCFSSHRLPRTFVFYFLRWGLRTAAPRDVRLASPRPACLRAQEGTRNERRRTTSRLSAARSCQLQMRSGFYGPRARIIFSPKRSNDRVTSVLLRSGNAVDARRRFLACSELGSRRESEGLSRRVLSSPADTHVTLTLATGNE